jgi:hypothetical protein
MAEVQRSCFSMVIVEYGFLAFDTGTIHEPGNGQSSFLKM